MIILKVPPKDGGQVFPQVCGWFGPWGEKKKNPFFPDSHQGFRLPQMFEK